MLYSVVFLFYAIFSNILAKLMPKFHKKLFLQISLIFICIGDLIMAPEDVIGLQNVWYLFPIGLVPVALGLAFSRIPLIPEYKEILMKRYPEEFQAT